MKVILKALALFILLSFSIEGLGENWNQNDSKNLPYILPYSNCTIEFGPSRLRYRQCYPQEVMTGVDALINGEVKYIYCAKLSIVCNKSANTQTETSIED